MYLVEKTFKEIQSIISDTEPPGNRDNVKADMQQVQKYEFEYKKWTEHQIENCKSLGDKIKNRKSIYFIDDIQKIYDKFKNNVTEHSDLQSNNDRIPDRNMNTIINSMQIISKYVQPYAEVAAYISVSPDGSTPTKANEKVLQYKTDANITTLQSQWHAICRLTEMVTRMAQAIGR